MQHDENVQWAVGKLIKAGYGYECKRHDGVYLDGGNEGAIEQAIDDAAKGRLPEGVDPDDLQGLFEEAGQMFGVECYSCEAVKDD